MMSLSRELSCQAASVGSMGVPCLGGFNSTFRRRVPTTSCRLVSVLEGLSSHELKVRRALSELPFANGRKPASSQQLKRRLHGLSSKGTFQPRSLQHRPQVMSLQAIATDNDSSSGDGVGSSAHAMNLSSVWLDREYLGPFFLSSLQGLQEGIMKVKERCVFRSSKEGWYETYSEVKIACGKFITDASHSKAVVEGARIWHNLKPWIKWPLIIFSVLYLAVSISFGLEVAQDLIPLWIIGPLGTGGIIRSVYWAVDSTKQCFNSTEPLRKAVIGGTLQVCNDAKSGILIGKLQTLAQLQINEAKVKRSQLELYVKSGQAATDFQIFMMVKFSQLWDWSTDVYADFLEWIRPYWRAFTRLMKKLF